MNKIQGTIIISLLVVIIMILLSQMVFGGKAQIVKWEYRIESIDDLYFTIQMQRLGEDGWELVFARRALAGEGFARKALYECIFKRPKGLK